MDIIKQIEMYYANMTKSERHAADVILANMEPLATDSVKNAAQKYKTSPTTLVRLSKRLEFTGYSEFSFQVKNYSKIHKTDSSMINSNAPHMSPLIQSFINSFSEMINPTIENGVNSLAVAMKNAKRIVAVGIGHSGLAAEHLKYLMLSSGLLVNTVTDEVLVKSTAPMIKNGDLIVIFSASGGKDTYKEIFNKAHEKKAKLALITMNPSAKGLINSSISLVVPTVHSINTSKTGIRYIDSRPVFYVLVSCLVRYYNDAFPEV